MATYTMKQLSEETGLTARTIRYYITQGLVPKAVGKGKRAHYTDTHLTRLRDVQHELDRGRMLHELKLVQVTGNVSIPSSTWTHYKLGPGVVLAVRGAVDPPHLRRYLKAFAKELKEK